MALTRTNEFDTGTTLTETKIEGEFDNIYSNALSLISPLSGNLNCNLKQLTNLLLENLGSSPVAATAGRIWFDTGKAQVEVDSGSAIYRVPTITSLTRGDLSVGSSTANTWARLAVGAANSVLKSDGTTVGDDRPLRSRRSMGMGQRALHSPCSAAGRESDLARRRWASQQGKAPTFMTVAPPSPGSRLVVEYASDATERRMCYSSAMPLLPSR